LITSDPAPTRNRIHQFESRGIVGAHSTELVRAQKDKFNINTISDLADEDEIIGKRASDDTVKNLFKVLCGVLNMPLK